MRYLLIPIYLVLAACAATSEDSQTNPKDDKKDEIIINVESAESTTGTATATFQSTAVLEADLSASVTSKTSGIILEILVEEGDRVEAGQTLLVLESDEQRLDVANAQANYDKSLNKYKRSQRLIEKGLINQEQLDDLKFETKALKSMLDQAKMRLSFTTIKSPIAGVVVKRHIKLGNLIQNATPVFDVVNFETLQAKIDVPEHQLNILKAGLPVSFEFDALPEQPFVGLVARIRPMIDTTSGTFEITVDVDNEAGLLRPGLFGRAQVIYDQRENVVLVAKDAVIKEDELAFVYAFDGTDAVTKTPVSLGYEMDEAYELLAGLGAGVEVITTGKNNLTPDTKVNVVKYDEAP